MTDTTLATDPERTALLVMDYQPGIIDRLDDGDGLLRGAREAIDMARAAHLRVGFVRIGFDDDDLAAMPAHAPMAARVGADGAAFRHDAPGTAVHDRLAPQDGDIIVRKTRVGAFSTTDLDEQLRSHGITTLILAGLSTSGVVLSTVRDGHDRDYRMFVLADATGDPDPEVHDFLLARIIPAQAEVITLDQLRGALADGRERA